MCRMTVISWCTGRVLPVRPRITRYGTRAQYCSPPLNLQTVVDSGEMLNVGDANLSYLSYDMLFTRTRTRAAASASYTEQGSWSVGRPRRVRWNPVTVNANIDANWERRVKQRGQLDLAGLAAGLRRRPRGRHANRDQSNGLPELQLYAISRWRYRDICVDPQFLDWGHYIPPEIQITAYNNAPENTADRHKSRSHIAQRIRAEESVCGTISDWAVCWPYSRRRRHLRR